MSAILESRIERTAFLGLALAAPNALYLALVLLVPLGIVAAYSLFTYSATGVALPALTLRNYATLADPYFLRLIGRTAGIALKTTAICIVLGYPLAYALARASRTLAAFGFFLLLTPLMVSPVVRALGWFVLLDRNGIANTLIADFGFERQQLLFSEPTVLLGLSHLLLPFMVLPLIAAIERIPRNLEEAARNLGVDLYPGAQVSQAGAASATIGGIHTVALNLETSDSVDQVCSFYKPRFANAMVTSTDPNQCTIVSNDHKNMISINARAENGRTRIVITNVSKSGAGSSSSN